MPRFRAPLAAVAALLCTAPLLAASPAAPAGADAYLDIVITQYGYLSPGAGQPFRPHASAVVKLISAADKLHNARSIRRDLARVGDRVFERFTASREDTLWYYRSLLEALGRGWSSALLDELVEEVTAMHAATGVPMG